MSVTLVYHPKSATTISGVVDENAIAFMEGDQTITGGVNMSAFTTGLAYVTFGPNFYGTIPASSPLRADIDFTDTGANSPVFEYGAGGGSVAFYAGGGSTTSARTKNISSGELILMGGGTHTKFEQGSGRSLVTTDVIVTTLTCSGGSTTVRYNSTAITTGIIDGGNATIMRSITTLDQAGGMLVVRSDDAGTNAPALTTGRITNGTFDWRGGDITNLYVYGNGTVDFSNVTQNVTVSNLYVTAAAMANMRNKWKGRKFNVTFSTVTVYGHKNDDKPSS